MPSSKVIKGAKADLAINSFSFRPVTAASATAGAEEACTTFVPLEIFDPTELGGRLGITTAKPATEPPPEPPGVFLAEEELGRQLQESYQRGLQDGKNLAERGLLNVFKSMRNAAEELQQLREKILRDSEDELLTLVIAVARRVVHQEVAQDRQIVLRVIRAALQDLHDSDELVVRVHPDDLALLTTSQDKALQQELSGFKFSLKGDVTLQPGCCQVETALGTVDASFEAQMGEIYRRLLEERTAGGPVAGELTPVEE